MVIYKEFTCSANVNDAVDFITVGGTAAVKQYPSAANQVAENLISALEELGVEMTYNEETFEACINDTKFYLVCDKDELSIFWLSAEGWLGCSVHHAGIVSDESVSHEFAIRVTGTVNSFEVAVGVQDFFGIYTLERAFDKKKLTAIKMNTSEGKFTIFENGDILELGQVIIPTSAYPSEFAISGVTLVPAVTTNFAYRILDAFLYIPFLQTGTYYEIADFSVVAVASCVLLMY